MSESTTKPAGARRRRRGMITTASFLLIGLIAASIARPSFSQSSADLQVVLPAAGAAFKPGDLLRIQWSYANASQPFPATAYLEREDTGASDRLEIGGPLAPTPGAVGPATFDWFIPNSVSPGHYAVTLTNFNGSARGSSGVFSVAALPERTQIRVLMPPQAAGAPLTTIASGGPATIAWDFPVGGAVPVDLYLDIFSGAALSSSLPIDRAIQPSGGPDPAQYQWLVDVPPERVPPDAQYKFRVAAASGAMGSSADFIRIGGAGAPATTATSTPISPSAPTSAASPAGAEGVSNYLQNGSFEAALPEGAASPWRLGVRPGAAAALARDSTTAADGVASLRVDISQPSPVAWYVQVSQGALPLVAGKTYLLSFWAKASAPRAAALVLQQDGEPWREYYHGSFDLGETWRQYNVTYAAAASDDMAALRFNLAAAGGQVWLDKVVYGEDTSAAGANPTGPAGGWHMIFHDEFDRTALDSGKWVTCYLYQWSNVGCAKTNGASVSWYMADDAVVSDGVLKLRAQRRAVVGSDGQTYAYSSGLISSNKDTYDPSVPPRFTYLYGYAEMRAKIPAGQGLWPAFWMLQADGQWPWEIDVLEALGHQPDTTFMTVHYPTANWDDAASSGAYSGPDFSAGYHTFGVEWAPDRIVWYVDGIERKRVTDRSQIPSAPMYLIACLAVGGDWPGPPDASTPFPAQMEIDYIRVWQRDN